MQFLPPRLIPITDPSDPLVLIAWLDGLVMGAVLAVAAGCVVCLVVRWLRRRR